MSHDYLSIRRKAEPEKPANPPGYRTLPAMHLVQILLPLGDNDQRSFPREAYVSVSQELIEQFGGMTAYSRAPAHGLWSEGESGVAKDDIAVYEVMTAELDREWWTKYRETLARRFKQQELVIRSHRIEVL